MKIYLEKTIVTNPLSLYWGEMLKGLQILQVMEGEKKQFVYDNPKSVTPPPPWVHLVHQKSLAHVTCEQRTV